MVLKYMLKIIVLPWLIFPILGNKNNHSYPPPKTPSIPGFKAVFAILALLMVLIIAISGCIDHKVQINITTSNTLVANKNSAFRSLALKYFKKYCFYKDFLGSNKCKILFFRSLTVIDLFS